MKHKWSNYHALLALALLPACHTAKHTQGASVAIAHTTAIDSTATRIWEDFAVHDTVDMVMSISRYEVSGDGDLEPKLRSVTVVDYSKRHNRSVEGSANVESVANLQSKAESKAETHTASETETPHAGGWRTAVCIILSISILIFTLFLILRR
ncbi:MAG: hypothetical protein K2J74_05140 [Muribaculaceae bacterium]|nr:hypothetical protein [Muribaculaceae bacterium]